MRKRALTQSGLRNQGVGNQHAKLMQDRFGLSHFERGGRSMNPALFLSFGARFTFHDRSAALRSETILL
jgi:hypothetical protein